MAMKGKRDGGLRLGSVLCPMVDPETGFAMAGAKKGKVSEFHIFEFVVFLKNVCSSEDLAMDVDLFDENQQASLKDPLHVPVGPITRATSINGISIEVRIIIDVGNIVILCAREVTREKLKGGEVNFWDGKKGKHRTAGLNLNQSFSLFLFFSSFWGVGPGAGAG